VSNLHFFFNFPCCSSRDFLQAKDCFAQGLNMVQAVLHNPRVTPAQENIRFVIAFLSLAEHSLSEAEPQNKESCHANEIACLVPAQFSMHVTKHHRQDAVDLDDLVDRPCSCLVYNIGLAIQAIAMVALHEDGFMSETIQGRLLASVRLYECSNELQINSKSEMECQLFQLSLLSNTGRCYELLGEQTASRQCFQRLLEACLIIQQTPCFLQDQAHTRQVYQTFHYNIASLILKNFESAPAA
jgi:hypothetical protein